MFQLRQHSTTALLGSLLCLQIVASLTPADHLVPPPLPSPQRLIHNVPTSQSSYNFVHDTRKIHLRPPPPAQPTPALNYGGPQDQLSQANGGSGFMTRIARWFGFGGAPREQQLSPEASSNNDVSSYAYPKPYQPYEVSGKGKEPCNLCNRYPWVPMMQHLSHHQQQQQTPWQHSGNLEPQPSQHVPVKQRAVQFQQLPPVAAAPPHNLFLPVPVPNLSPVALPPLYNAQPFRPLPLTTSTLIPSATQPFTVQELPTSTPAHFAENIGAHSELQVAQIAPANAAGSTQNSFEIIKSHQLTDFVTSVEYPATFVQSHAIDLGPTGAQAPQHANHKVNYSSAHSEPTTSEIDAIKYQLSNVNTNHYLPGSQLLTQLATQQIFEPTTTTTAPPTFDYETQTVAPQSNAAAAVGASESYYETADNYPAASSAHQQQHNTQQTQFEPWRSLYYETTTTLPVTPAYEPLNVEYTTAQPYADADSELETTQTTAAAAATDIEILHVPAAAAGAVPVHSAIKNHLPDQQQQQQQQKVQPAAVSAQRGTPKRLLDAPIKYAQNGLPRPFTRDPAELSFRTTHTQYANHVYHPTTASDTAASTSTAPASFQTTFTSTHAPTPTSTYGAIDASGQYAGMSPPPLLTAHNVALQQVVIPYTTKHKPRPFEPTRPSRDNAQNRLVSGWTHANDIELHEQQESKLISTATAAPPIANNGRPRTTKYLTKILASNLRELLKRERETKHNKALGFDISKLQKNIDGWTEQEYNSLSHRPSTPTIRGRSKHIPSEYLTTTTMATPTNTAPDTTTRSTSTVRDNVPDNVSELSTSINNLEQLLNAAERSSRKRFQYVSHIDDNNLLDYYELRQREREREREHVTVKTTTAATTTTTTTKTTTELPATSTTTVAPYYVRTPQVLATELWKKAKVAISPQTNEKVYVVTPQPRYQPQRTTTLLAHTEVESVTEASKAAKSPRFIVRPTPGSVVRTNAHQQQTYTPDIFGLMGLSSFVPADPVEIIDGNSKVITIVTAAPHAAQAQEQRLQSAKSTMSPSPR